MEKHFELMCFEVVFWWTVYCSYYYVIERACNLYGSGLDFWFGVVLQLKVRYCGFNKDCCAPMGCSVGMICTAEVISGDDKVGFGGEVSLTNEEDVSMVKIEEKLYFIFILVEPICIPLRNP